MLRSCKSWDWALPRRENGTRLEGVLTSCCFSSLYLGRRDAITLRSRMRVMRSTSLASTFSSFLFVFFFLFPPPHLSSSSCVPFPLYRPSKARRTLKVVKKFCSQSHDPFSQSCGCWSTDEETGEQATKGYTGIEHGTLSANTTIVLHRMFHFNEPSGIRNSFNFIQRTFSFSTLELVSMKFYRDQRGFRK